MDTSKLHDQLYFTTCFIEAHSGQSVATGTGFFYQHTIGESTIPVIVTCRHVVDGFDKGLVRFISSDDGLSPKLGKAFTLTISDMKSWWHFHPDPAIDIAVMGMAPLYRHLAENGKKIFYRKVEESILPKEEQLKDLSAIEEVIFVGYPNGIFDKKNLLPVARRGITASPMHVDYNGLPTFLIDAAVFPGSSGSPVFIATEGTYRSGNVISIGSRVFFLGVVAAAHFSEQRGRIIIESTPTAQVAVPVTQQLLNLGIVFKGSTVIQAIEDFVRHRQPSVFESTTDSEN